MNWREILKVSGVVAVAFAILDIITTFVGPIPEFAASLFPALLSGGLVTTAVVLHRRLRKEDWGILAGVSLTYVLYVVLIVVASSVGL